MTAYGIQDLTATILWKNHPIVDFKVKHGKAIYIKSYEQNRSLFPLEFKNRDIITLDDINLFVEARIVPQERFNLMDVLAEAGISEYRWEPILKYVHGLCTDDCYWFRFEDELLTYEDVKMRD